MSYYRRRNVRREPTISGCVQTGPARLEIEERREDGSILYRVVADVRPHWGNEPKPGAVWVLQSGLTPHGEDELRERVSALYGVGRAQGDSLYGYRGPVSGYPYVQPEAS